MRGTPVVNGISRVVGQIQTHPDHLDAFGRERVAQPTTIFESQFQYNKLPLIWGEAAQGGVSQATHIPLESAIRLQCDATPGDFIVRQSKSYVRYQPGKSQLVIVTGNLGASETGFVKAMGLFDGNTGVYLGNDENGLYFAIRDDGADVTIVRQADWTEDTLDGTGASGETLDSTKVQILLLDLQWLGAGSVRFGFSIGGKTIWASQVDHANINSTMYMTTANLPIRYEIRNVSATVATNDMLQICSSVMSEGGFDQALSFPRSAYSDLTTPVTVSNTALTPIMSLRLAPTFNAIENRGLVVPTLSNILVDTADDVLWGLVLNGTLTGAAFASVDAESIAEVDLTASAITGGILIESGFASSTNQGRTPVNPDIDLARLLLSRNVDNSDSDVLTLVAQGIGTAADVLGSMVWRELY